MKLILIFIFIFHKGNSEDKLEISPVNGTFVIIGSSLTFLCVTPCNSPGNALIEFAEFSKLSATPCHENYTEKSRMVFSCNDCEYRLQIQAIQTQDHRKPFKCIFKPNDDNTMTSTTYINVEKAIIVPANRLYTDGDRTQFKCLLYENDLFDGPLSLTFEFKCHGKEVYMDLKYRTATINVTVDINYDGTKCTCAAYDQDNVYVKSEITLNISLYQPELTLPAQYKLPYGNPVTLTCMAVDLMYPFGLGSWFYTSNYGERQLTKVVQTPSDISVTVNNNNSTSLNIHNATYEKMGTYQCTVVDLRKNKLVVGNSTTRLMVEGPILLDDIFSERLNNNCKFRAMFRSFPKISVISWWKNYKRVKTMEMKTRNTIEEEAIRQNYSSDSFSCSVNSTFGLIASNGITTIKRYFDSEGKILNLSPILQVHGKLIDGYPVSVVCYDISLTNTSYLSLTCDNINDTISHDFIDDHAHVVQISFNADVDDQKGCSCINTFTRESKAVNLAIKTYKPLNSSSPSKICDSSSKISLKCSYPDLPASFIFNGWVHHFNGVKIRELDGPSNGKETTLHIPFCTYEDIGNYTCIVVDNRKNKTILNSTIHLDVPGPPVIINTSVVELGGRQGCQLNVSFYSFDKELNTTWYKNGKKLISSENMKQSLKRRKHHMAIYGSFVPLDAYFASLHLKPKCDVEENVYSFRAYTSVFKASHTFQADDHTVRKVLIVSMIVATGMFVAGLNVTICKAFKDAKSTKRVFTRNSLYARAVRGIRDTLFFEEIYTVIDNMRQHDQGIEGPRPLTFCESTYEHIPYDIDVSTPV